jgi:hypothetical protein|nr:MAG TPA: zinc-ribbon domain protein [Caudoviricetes sp.]
MGVISDKLKNLQKTYKENNYAEYDQILHFAIEIAEEEENKYCEWHIVDKPNGLPVYHTGCGQIRICCATGIDIYCNNCGKKIKVVRDLKGGDVE